MFSWYRKNNKFEKRFLEKPQTLTFTYRMLKVLVSRAQNICIAEDHWKKKLEHLEKIFQVCDNYAQ